MLNDVSCLLLLLLFNRLLLLIIIIIMAILLSYFCPCLIFIYYFSYLFIFYVLPTYWTFVGQALGNGTLFII